MSLPAGNPVYVYIQSTKAVWVHTSELTDPAAALDAVREAIYGDEPLFCEIVATRTSTLVRFNADHIVETYAETEHPMR